MISYQIVVNNNIRRKIHYLSAHYHISPLLSENKKAVNNVPTITYQIKHDCTGSEKLFKGACPSNYKQHLHLRGPTVKGSLSPL